MNPTVTEVIEYLEKQLKRKLKQEEIAVILSAFCKST